MLKAEIGRLKTRVEAIRGYEAPEAPEAPGDLRVEYVKRSD